MLKNSLKKKLIGSTTQKKHAGRLLYEPKLNNAPIEVKKIASKFDSFNTDTYKSFYLFFLWKQSGDTRSNVNELIELIKKTEKFKDKESILNLYYGLHSEKYTTERVIDWICELSITDEGEKSMLELLKLANVFIELDLRNLRHVYLTEDQIKFVKGSR